MNACQTCGGYGDKHDPVAHGTEPDGPRGCRGWEWGLCAGIGCEECNGKADHADRIEGTR